MPIHQHASSSSGGASLSHQVEFYFSDANLPTDKHLLKHIKKDPEGFGEWHSPYAMHACALNQVCNAACTPSDM